MKEKTKITSIRILSDLYKEFKVIALKEDFPLQKLVNRSMDKYNKDKKYKRLIVEYKDLISSGSNF